MDGYEMLDYVGYGVIYIHLFKDESRLFKSESGPVHHVVNVIHVWKNLNSDLFSPMSAHNRSRIVQIGIYHVQTWGALECMYAHLPSPNIYKSRRTLHCPRDKFIGKKVATFPMRALWTTMCYWICWTLMHMYKRRRVVESSTFDIDSD